MNTLDGYVKEVISPVYEEFGKYFVDVIYDCYGRESTTDLMFSTLEEAEEVKVGYTFIC